MKKLLRLTKKGFGVIEILLILIVITLIAGLGYYVYAQSQMHDKSISSFEECVAAGNPVMESYPEQCNANGRNFVNPAQSFDAPQ